MDRTAVITGGAQGIGLGIVRHLLEDRWRVAALDIDDEALDELYELSKMFPDSPLLPLWTDVSNENDVVEAFISIHEWQEENGQPEGFDLLVNNAGITKHISCPIDQMALDDWKKLVDSHLTSTFLCTRSAVSGLRKRKGSIVNVSSTRAFQSEPDYEAYAAAKGGIISLTHALAVSLGPEIRVNAVCPGWIETGHLQKKSCRRPVEHRDIDRSQHPVGRVGEVSDIASLVAFLAGPQAGFITGQHFIADGGMTRKMIYEP